MIAQEFFNLMARRVLTTVAESAGRQKTIYFIGIGGTAMAGAAVMARQLGFRVRGADANIYPPTLNELGYDMVYDSPFGVAGPKGMDPDLTRRLHDVFKKTLEDPAVLSTFEKFDQTVIYMNTEDYTKFARESFAAEKATIERLGMANKG